MSGNKHAAALSLENSAVSDFLNKDPQVNRLKIMSEQLKLAGKSPDVRPADALAQVALPVAPTPVEEVAPAALAPQQPARPAAVEPQAAFHHAEEASYVVEADGLNRGGRPRHGKERKVERTVSMDRSLDKILERLGPQWRAGVPARSLLSPDSAGRPNSTQSGRSSGSQTPSCATSGRSAILIVTSVMSPSCLVEHTFHAWACSTPYPSDSSQGTDKMCSIAPRSNVSLNVPSSPVT